MRRLADGGAKRIGDYLIRRNYLRAGLAWWREALLWIRPPFQLVLIWWVSLATQ